MPIQLLLNQPNVLNLLHPVFKRAMAEIKPTGIHSGSNYFLQHCRVAGRRPNCRQDASTLQCVDMRHVCITPSYLLNRAYSNTLPPASACPLS